MLVLRKSSNGRLVRALQTFRSVSTAAEGDSETGTSSTRRNHTPDYCFPTSDRPAVLRRKLDDYKYHVFKSPTKSGIFGKKIGPVRSRGDKRNRPLLESTWNLNELPDSKLQNMPDEHQKPKVRHLKRKPNMKSNLLQIGGGKHAPNLALKLLQQVNVSEMVRAVVLGSLLGHGNLFVDMDRYPDKAVFYFRNHKKHEEYFAWKMMQLKEYAFEHSLSRRAEKYEFRTVPVKEFGEMRVVTTRKNHTVVKRKWLNHLTPVALAVWWCDRGNIIARGTKGQFMLDRFDKESVEIVQQYLKVMWKVETDLVVAERLGRKRNDKTVDETYYRLFIRTPQLKIFLRIIMRYVPVPSMIKKTVILHDTVGKQKSWIAEMKEAMPQWVEEIDREVARQKEHRVEVRRAARLREAAQLGGDKQVLLREKRRPRLKRPRKGGEDGKCVEKLEGSTSVQKIKAGKQLRKRERVKILRAEQQPSDIVAR